ncbi:MAG: hypothetical protein HGA38_04315 [Candidatus Moranbacteria bacterium]|nr:hypothetical protein [Candidatus Moranbacteria bacterium]
MQPRVFPLKTKRNASIDGISSAAAMPTAGRRLAPGAGPVRSEVISRGRRVSVVSFSEDSRLYSRYAIETLGERPGVLSSIRTVDGLRKPGFSGVTPPRRRPFVIELPRPEFDFNFGFDFGSMRNLSLPSTDRLEAAFRSIGSDLSSGLSGFRLGLTSGRFAYAPLVGAMALGMVSALFLEHSFGEGAKADDKVRYVAATTSLDDGRVLGAETEKGGDTDTDEILRALSVEDPSKKAFEKRVREMVKGYPIEDMVPYLMEQDRTVAIFYIAIARKESNWGKRVPVLDGQDCFNYVGYRGIRKMMGTGGHTCFNSREDAVKTVSKRLHTLIYDNKLDTPDKLIVWKCGSSCAGHSSYSVQKWKDDVDYIYGKLND